jgi:hypothetical protein
LLDVLAASGDDLILPAIVWQNLEPALQQDRPSSLAALLRRAGDGGRGLAPLMPRVVHWLLVSGGQQLDVAGQLVLALVDQPAARQAAAECLEAIHQAARHGDLSEAELGALREQLGQRVSTLFATTSHDRLTAAAAGLAIA